MPLMLNLKEGVRMMKKIYEYEQVQAFRDNPDQLAELLADVVNSYSFGNKDQEKFAEAIMRRHKTLQQSIFGMILTTISKWREAWENDNYDLRNEYTCMACNVIMEAIETKGGYAKGAPIHPPYI